MIETTFQIIFYSKNVSQLIFKHVSKYLILMTNISVTIQTKEIHTGHGKWSWPRLESLLIVQNFGIQFTWNPP